MARADAARCCGRPKLWMAFVLLCARLVTTGIHFTVLPNVVLELEGGSAEDDDEVAHAQETYSRVIALASFLQFFFVPLWGAVSDRRGRVPVLRLGITFTTANYLLIALAPGIWAVYLGSALYGMTAVFFATVNCFIIDISPDRESRSKNLGLAGVAFGVAFLFGPILGGVLATVSLRLPYFVAAAIESLTLLFTLVVLPESNADKLNTSPLTWREWWPLAAMAMLWRTRYQTLITVSLAMYQLAVAGVQYVFVLYSEHRYGWDMVETAAFLACYGLSMAVSQGPVLRALMPRFGEEWLLTRSLMLTIVAFAMFGLATEGWMVFATVVITVPAYLSQPIYQGLMSHTVTDAEQGMMQGAIHAMMTVTEVIGPLSSGVLFSVGITEIGVPGLPFFGMVIFLVVALATAILAGRLPATRPPKPDADVADAEVELLSGMEDDGVDDLQGEIVGEAVLQ